VFRCGRVICGKRHGAPQACAGHQPR